MWNLVGSGIEPVFPALAGGFLSTAPPGKSLEVLNVFNTRQGFGPFYPRLTMNEVLKVLFVKHVSSEWGPSGVWWVLVWMAALLGPSPWALHVNRSCGQSSHRSCCRNAFIPLTSRHMSLGMWDEHSWCSQRVGDGRRWLAYWLQSPLENCWVLTGWEETHSSHICSFTSWTALPGKREKAD